MTSDSRLRVNDWGVFVSFSTGCADEMHSYAASFIITAVFCQQHLKSVACFFYGRIGESEVATDTLIKKQSANMWALIAAVMVATGLVTTATAMVQLPASGSLIQTRPYDVLLIAVDDLRTELSIYPEGLAVPMRTPNVERIAQRGVVFERAYVQVALCMPSRTSLLTSRRPDTSRSWTIEADQYWRVSGGNFTTLPQRFKQVLE